MKDIQQLIKKSSNLDYLNIYPNTFIDAIIDKLSGKSLKDILNSFNMYFLSYDGNTEHTRLLVPQSLRKLGLWITYVKYDKTVNTEWYNGDLIDDDSWKNSSNWVLGENMLQGDITISGNGNWIINGIETNIQAKGDKGITPQVRIYENKLLVSYTNGTTWKYINDTPIAAWFRFLGDVGANIGKILISRDEGKTWSDLSNNFTNNLYIKGYVATQEDLPQNANLGDIYGVGPTYIESDLTHTNPIYNLYIKNNNKWVDNGRFTSLLAGIDLELVDSSLSVPSSKAVLDYSLNKKQLLLKTYTKKDFTQKANVEGMFVNENGKVVQKVIDTGVISMKINTLKGEKYYIFCGESALTKAFILSDLENNVYLQSFGTNSKGEEYYIEILLDGYAYFNNYNVEPIVIKLNKITINKLSDTYKNIISNILKFTSYVNDINYGNLLSAFNNFKLEYSDLLYIADLINKHKEIIYKTDFSSMETLEKDFEYSPFVNQKMFPHVIERPKENIKIENGVLKLFNILNKEESQNKDLLRFTCGHILMKNIPNIHNLIVHEGMLECNYRICQVSGINNSFWANTEVDKNIGDSYFRNNFPDLVLPSGNYFSEIDINEGKYPNFIDTTIHLWHGDALDGSYKAGSKSKSLRTPLIKGTLFNKNQYNILLPNNINTKEIRIKIFGVKNTHINKVLLFSKTPTTNLIDLYNLNLFLNLFQESLNYYNVVESIHDSGNLNNKHPATFICSKEQKGDYVCAPGLLFYVTIKFKKEVPIKTILMSTGYSYNSTDGSFILEYKDSNSLEYIEFYNNKIEPIIMSDIYNYKFIWNKEYCYWLLNNKLIFKLKNELINRYPKLKFSTMVMPSAGEINENIDGTYMEVLNATIYK